MRSCEHPTLTSHENLFRSLSHHSIPTVLSFGALNVILTNDQMVRWGRRSLWQLAGQQKPEFVAFMHLHDRRAFNPAHRIERGKFLIILSLAYVL
jgi:hypothetical protein